MRREASADIRSSDDPHQIEDIDLLPNQACDPWHTDPTIAPTAILILYWHIYVPCGTKCNQRDRSPPPAGRSPPPGNCRKTQHEPYDRFPQTPGTGRGQCGRLPG